MASQKASAGLSLSSEEEEAGEEEEEAEQDCPVYTAYHASVTKHFPLQRHVPCPVFWSSIIHKFTNAVQCSISDRLT